MARLAIAHYFSSNSTRKDAGSSDYSPVLVSIVQLLQQLFNVWSKRRSVTAGGVPHDVQVDVEVAVNENISHPDDLRPLDIRRHGSHVFGQRPGRLPDNLLVADEPFLQELVLLKGCPSPVQVALNSGNGLETVPQPFSGVPHNGSASR